MSNNLYYNDIIHSFLVQEHVCCGIIAFDELTQINCRTGEANFGYHELYIEYLVISVFLFGLPLTILQVIAQHLKKMEYKELYL